MIKVICDLCKEKKAKYKVNFSLTEDDSFLANVINGVLAPPSIDICKECYKERLLRSEKTLNCSNCADRNKCAIHDNFNIQYCSDYRPGISTYATGGIVENNHISGE